MNEGLVTAKTHERQGEMNALRRAAKRAREVAARTGTPLVVVRDGKVVKLVVEKDEQAG